MEFSSRKIGKWIDTQDYQNLNIAFDNGNLETRREIISNLRDYSSYTAKQLLMKALKDNASSVSRLAISKLEKANLSIEEQKELELRRTSFENKEKPIIREEKSSYARINNLKILNDYKLMEIYASKNFRDNIHEKAVLDEIELRGGLEVLLSKAERVKRQSETEIVHVNKSKGVRDLIIGTVSFFIGIILTVASPNTIFIGLIAIGLVEIVRGIIILSAT